MKRENPRFPHKVVITREVDRSTPFDEDIEDVVVYEGDCRSYTQSTASGSGKVIGYERRCSLPVSCDEWTIENLPVTGDRIEITKGVIVETGEILDVRPNNFGTDIIFDYVKN